MAILPRFLRPRGSEDAGSPNNESDIFWNLATGLATRDRGSRRRNEPPLPSQPLPPSLTELGTLSTTGGSPNAADRLPRNPVARVLTAADFPIIFGSAAPAPAPAPRRQPRRRRTRRTREKPKPRRTRPTRPSVPRVEPPQPEAPSPRKSPPIKIPLPRTLPSVPGLLFDIWKTLLDEYLKPRPRVNNPGGPRRGGERTRQPNPLPPMSLPSPGPLNVPPLPSPTPRAPPSEIFTAPSTVSSPFPDPYTYVPAPARAPATRPSPRRQLGPQYLVGNPFPMSQPQRSPLRRQPRRQGERDPLRERDIPQQRNPPRQSQPLTPLRSGQLESTPYNSDPCAMRARETKRRQRQKRKECKKFVTKEIRVCQSFNEK